MNRKDRIAVVITIFWLLFGSVTISNAGTEIHPPHFFIVLGVLCYWSYRFIKDDISFIKTEDKD